jgi:acetolactate synthase-1/3 small subunit
MPLDLSEVRRYTIAILVENRFGVLSRVSGLFSGRGYNIDSLSVAETLDPTIARMTIVARATQLVIEQLVKQLHKLIDVIKVIDLTDEEHVSREMLLLRVGAAPATRAEILRIADIFRAKIVDVTPLSYTLEVTGDESKISAIVELLRPFGIQEVVRTGKVAIARGSKILSRKDQTKLQQLQGAPRAVGYDS